MLLLRRAVAGLRRAHDPVLLIAPRSSGAALVGPGPSEVDELIPWEGPDVAALLAGNVAPGSLRDRLGGIEVAVAYSRSEDLGRHLPRYVSRVLIHDPAPPPGIHASRWLARPLEALGLGVPDDVEPVRPTEAEALEARALLASLPEGYLAIHPGSGSPRKTWPAERFAALLDGVAGSGPWLLVEGPADSDAVSRLARRPGTVVARGLSARTLGAVLARARLFVGHDSGVSHLAAAWGTPTLALFGPTDPSVWAPVGPHVRVVRAPSAQMDTLSVESVLTAARQTFDC